MLRRTSMMLFAATLLAAGVASAQQQAAPFNPYIPTPDPGCSATPAQLEANKKVALQFFAPGADRVAITDVTYKQHNPAFIKGAREANMSDFDYFKSRFGGPPAARGGGAGQGGGRQGGAPAGPQAPQAAPYEWAMAQCDIVFILRKQNRQDPTLPAGNFYEAFTFDMFRIRNGKLVEHWVMAQINAPAAGRGGRGN